MSPSERIVVGVDGSEASLDALRWAARQAQLTGATLEVLTAWAYPEHPTPFGIVPELPLPPDPTKETMQRLEATIHDMLGASPRITVRARVERDHAAPALLAAARGAQLLVVGSRGHGAFAEMLLGSVSEHCVRHAPCPVVVVRHAKEPA